MRLFFAVSAMAAMAWAQTPAAAPAPDSPPDIAKVQSALDRANRTLQDWPLLGRYRDANSQLAPAAGNQTGNPAGNQAGNQAAGEDRVVFMGDSITDGWGRRYGKFFPGKPYVNRGISGQTTPQMLIRFRPDAIALKPKAVVILAGTNDIAGNTGPMTLEAIEDNLMSMAELAAAHGIRVVMSSVMPVCDYIGNQTTRRPPERIKALNAWMKDYAGRHGAVYLDYYSAMLDDAGMFKKELTYDGLHPNDAGYEVMVPLAEKAIAEALK
ncbi:MAG TPA: SGNH/GDSL hydrolase family protein [Candidatus Solibacter sp.]|nr:SGNH/GDSL hydrolase family protein [Candidatus Solibacter sp.]